MDELVSVMEEIKELLSEMNRKLDETKGSGLYNSLSDVYDKLDEIQGNKLYNSLSDICDKLDSITK